MTTTTKKTTTNKKRSPSVKATETVKLDRNCFQHEILELASKQRSNAKKVEVLQEYRNNALVSLFIWNFDETVVSLLPPGDVPYADLKEMTAVGGTLSDKLGRQTDGIGMRSIAYNGVEERMDAGKTSLRNEYEKLYNFVRGGNPTLSSIRRETMFINMLQGMHPLEAELLCLVKDKKLTDKYKITWDNVREAYPDIKWGGRS
jgi:hypothetical protein